MKVSDYQDCSMFSIHIGIRARLIEEGRGGMRILISRKKRREKKGSSTTSSSSSIPFSLGQRDTDTEFMNRIGFSKATK